jgi:hypothetical protein
MSYDASSIDCLFFMTLRAISLCCLGKGLFPVVANAAARFLRVIFDVHLKITLFHLEDFGMAFIAFHFGMRFMTEDDRIRSFRCIGYVSTSHLLGLNTGYRKTKKTKNA